MAASESGELTGAVCQCTGRGRADFLGWNAAPHGDYLSGQAARYDGCVERIAVGFNSFPLGITAKAEYPEFVYRLQEGETISIMSDGISDATNERDEQFSELRICETLRNSSGEDATKLGRRLIAAIRKFAEPQPQTDDQTLVVFKRLENSECPDGPDSPE